MSDDDSGRKLYDEVRLAGSLFFNELTPEEQLMWVRASGSVDMDAKAREVQLASKVDGARAILNKIAAEVGYDGDEALGLPDAVRAALEARHCGCSIVDEILGRRPGEGVHEAARRVTAELEQAKAKWSSPIGLRERWAGENPEPIPFPRAYNDLYQIQCDYMRAIECSSSGPTPEERAEKVDSVFRASMDLTYEVTHLRAQLEEARTGPRPFPELRTPAAMRYAADVIEVFLLKHADEKPVTVMDADITPRTLRVDADMIERDQQTTTHVVSPELPEHGTPDAMRYAAEEVAQQCKRHQVNHLTADDLHAWATEIEDERAAAEAEETVALMVARVMHENTGTSVEFEDGQFRNGFVSRARNLIADPRITVTITDGAG